MALTKAKVVVFGPSNESKALFLKNFLRSPRPVHLFKESGTIDFGNVIEGDVIFETWYSQAASLPEYLNHILVSDTTVGICCLHKDKFTFQSFDAMHRFKEANPHATLAIIIVKPNEDKETCNLSICGYMKDSLELNANPKIIDMDEFRQLLFNWFKQFEKERGWINELKKVKNLNHLIQIMKGNNQNLRQTLEKLQDAIEGLPSANKQFIDSEVCRLFRTLYDENNVNVMTSIHSYSRACEFNLRSSYPSLKILLLRLASELVIGLVLAELLFFKIFMKSSLLLKCLGSILTALSVKYFVESEYCFFKESCNRFIQKKNIHKINSKIEEEAIELQKEVSSIPFSIL